MINNQKTKIVAICIIIIFGCIAISSAYFSGLIRGPRGPTDLSILGVYKIDPKTILEKLNQGDIKVFTQVLTTPESYEKSYVNPFLWTQSDYLKIVSALHQYTGNDSFENWQVYSMMFYGDCQYDPVGFDLFKIVYIKDIGSQKYNAREISIYPLYEGVSVSQQTNLPRPMFGLNSINLDELKVTANEALQIAEENGGRGARLTIENQCHISISSGGQDWHVRYSHENPSFVSSIFEININSYTGNYKILEINH